MEDLTEWQRGVHTKCELPDEKQRDAMRGLIFLIVGLLLVTLGGCSLNALRTLRDQVDNLFYNKAPKIEIQTVPEGPGESKVICGDRVITRDKDGNIIKVEPLKN